MKEIQIFHTILTTYNNERIIIPNGGISTGTINNLSTERFRRVEWRVSISYGDSVELARKVALEIIADEKRIVFSVRRAKVDETGHLVDCEIKVAKPDVNPQLADEMEELMKAYYPWRVLFINGEYRAYGIEKYVFVYLLE